MAAASFNLSTISRVTILRIETNHNLFYGLPQIVYDNMITVLLPVTLPAGC
ncbi:hypothetical protein Nizo2891_2212 [Lactiplantibacillus plantarum]|nr:hypothetical protein Nizo2891_2212 [Lactiplantibacillus plantarum]